MYGVHAATSTIPALADIAYGAGTQNPNQTLLLAIYGAYFVMPALIALTMARTRIPFPTPKKKKVA